jgi:hypothetical protein
MDKIASFSDEFRFLSNFFPSPFIHNDILYKSVEHFYQAQKTIDIEKRKELAECKTAAIVKKESRKITIREDWEAIKDKVMWTGLANKFIPGSELAEMLLATEDLILEEGNYWGDVYWGVDSKTGKGKNKLGKMLMKLRKILKENK